MLSKKTRYGIASVYCDHDSLCKVVSKLDLKDNQIIQIGHWSTSTKWLQSCFTIGNYELLDTYFDRATIVCTEVVAGSAEALIQTARRPPFTPTVGLGKRRRGQERQSFVPNDTTRLNRSTQMVWFSATLEERQYSPEFPEFIDGVPTWSSSLKTTSFPDGTKMYQWKSKEALIQQRPRAPCGNHRLSWHLVVPAGTFVGYPGLRPSDLFNLRRNYWAETVNSKGLIESPDDWAMPKNTLEESLGPQSICEGCVNALNGTTGLLASTDATAVAATAGFFNADTANAATVNAVTANADTADADTELIEVDSVYQLAPSLQAIYKNLLYVLTLNEPN